MKRLLTILLIFCFVIPFGVVAEPPKISLVVKPTSGEAPLTVVASEGSSDSSIVEWHYDFGDGANSKEKEAEHIYDKPGQYTVNLVVLNDKGEESKDSTLVDVLEPKPTESPTPTEVPTAIPTVKPTPSDSVVALKSGITATDKTSVDISGGVVEFKNIATGISATTSTKIDGVTFVPSVQKVEGSDFVYGTGEKGALNSDDPVVKFSYTYYGSQLKETITLKAARVLSFKIDVSEGSELVPWDNGQYKIISTTSGNTMDGLVALKPYGIDANKRYVEMNYNLDKKTNTLTLAYDNLIPVYNETLTKENDGEPQYDFFPIVYPLTIDPTWVSYQGHWIDTTTFPGETVEMWNATGSSNWTTAYEGATAWYVLVAGGGGGGYRVGGGGGGAGAYWEGNLSQLTAGNKTIVVGAGGAASGAANTSGTSGANSTFANITAWGGSGGGTFKLSNVTGGGSSGGGSANATAGGTRPSNSTVETGHGNVGGTGLNTSATNYQGGGGGGMISTGWNAASNKGGDGGNATMTNITGSLLTLAGGGGGGVYSSTSGNRGLGGRNATTGVTVGGSGSYRTTGASAAVASTGSGGGGSGSTGAPTAGSAGLVIIRYNTSQNASFTVNATSGVSPVDLQFNDTSLGVPTAWNWSFTNVTGNNTEVWFSTTRNATVTFGAGNFSIHLNASTPYMSNVSTQVTFINITAPDLPPASITNLANTTTCKSINWTWTEPADSDLNVTMIYKNGTWFSNASNTTEYQTWIDLVESTAYTFSSRTVDTAGGVNASWVNQTANTLACPPVVVADFTSNVTSGTSLPLPVLFTDASTNSPTGWSWYFGDEPYNQTWVQQNASSFGTRYYHSIVTLPDGSIVFIGGWNGANRNDTWRSTDKGVTWTNITGTPGWESRRSAGAVALSDGSIVMSGGYTTTQTNDTWRSTNNGTTWYLQSSTPGWEARSAHNLVEMPDNSIILLGGSNTAGQYLNDTWRSTDKGVTWTLMNASSGWVKRLGFASVALPDNSIVVIGGDASGGVYKNDTWRSTDYGSTWTLQNASSSWTSRKSFSAVASQDGNIILMGGNSTTAVLNDTWRSADKGVSWTQMSSSSAWTARYAHATTTLPDGSIILVGGSAAGGSPLYGDTWRLNVTGASTQNPVHTFTSYGNYSITLTASSNSNYNSTPPNTHWVNITLAPPVASFTPSGETTGGKLKGIQFRNTSTGTVTSLSWQFNNITPGNATWVEFAVSSNPSYSFGVGNFMIRLNATNSGGTNTSTQTTWINVTQEVVASFTKNATSGVVPVGISFTDTSTGSPTSWGWYFGDENWTSDTWVQQSASGGWDSRFYHASTVMKNGNVILFGGWNVTSPKNDTWKSVDKGATWTLVNSSSGWQAREAPCGFTMADDSIVIFGGFNNDTGMFFNDTWRSTDSGSTWFNITGTPGISARVCNGVVLPDDSIVIMGGYDDLPPLSTQNDTWRSTDKGVTWTEVNASSGWSARDLIGEAVLPDGSIVITGGVRGNDSVSVNDIWRSTDSGSSWVRQNSTAGWAGRDSHSLIAMPDGSLVQFAGTNGGSDSNSTWRSTDKGVSWLSINSSPGWTKRFGTSAVLLPDGSILFTGGGNLSDVYYGDTWRFNPTGAATQNPEHLYTVAGNYSVVLVANSTTHYNATAPSVSWVNLTAPPAPVSSFTTNVTAGVIPLVVLFNDTSTNTPTAWNWSWGDATWTNGTTQNTTHTYVATGAYKPYLITSNVGGSNTSANVTINAYNRTTANFTQSETAVAVPPSNLVNYYTNSVNATMWNWSFHDGTWFNTTTASAANTSYRYDVGGNFTINLTTSDSGYGTSTKYSFLNATQVVTPVTAFTSNVTTGTANLSVQFNDTSTNTATVWNWTYRNVTGDGVERQFGKNILTVQQAGEEGGTIYWYGNTGSETITLNTTYAWEGSKSVKLVTANTSINEGEYSSGYRGIQPSTPYIASAYIRGESGGEVVRVCLAQFYENLTQITGSSCSGGVTLTTSWTRINSTPVTTNSLATSAKMSVLVSGQQQSTWFIDGMQIETGTVPTDWDGSTAQDPVKVFSGGNYSIVLNASNPYGYNVSSQVTFINVTPGVFIPAASLLPRYNTIRIPGLLQVNDTSAGERATNGGFETGNDFGWLTNDTDGTGGVYTWAKQSGTYGYYWNNWGSVNRSVITNVDLTGVSTVTFWYRNVVAHPPDTLSLYVQVGSNTPVLINTSTANVSYQQGSISTSSYSGIQPIRFFGYDSASVTSDWYLDNLSVVSTASGTPTVWNWSWGDGTWTNGTVQNETHQYTTRGAFPVYLIASNSAGANTSVSNTVKVVGYEDQWY